MFCIFKRMKLVGKAVWNAKPIISENIISKRSLKQLSPVCGHPHVICVTINHRTRDYENDNHATSGFSKTQTLSCRKDCLTSHTWTLQKKTLGFGYFPCITMITKLDLKNLSHRQINWTIRSQLCWIYKNSPENNWNIDIHLVQTSYSRRTVRPLFINKRIHFTSKLVLC